MARRSRWNNAALWETFDLFNARYWDGRLERPAILSFRAMNGNLGHTYRLRTPGQRRSQQDKFGIAIGSQLRYSKRLWATTLLHEMVHLEQRNKYSCAINGHHFNRRMKQLALAGAFNGLW